MKKINIPGVYKYKNQLFTENLECCKGKSVYGEKIVNWKGREYRAWSSYRSKLSAAILNGLKIDFEEWYKVLYLGAGTGTTVSHISDIVKNGTIYAVEISPVTMKKFIENCKHRSNIIPILEDANHYECYLAIVPKVDLIYQDISQRNQAEIFVSNIFSYLKKNRFGILILKARSIDVSAGTKDIYDSVCSYLKKKYLEVVDLIDLSPFEKDHAAIVVRYS